MTTPEPTPEHAEQIKLNNDVFDQMEFTLRKDFKEMITHVIQTIRCYIGIVCEKAGLGPPLLTLTDNTGGYTLTAAWNLAPAGVAPKRFVFTYEIDKMKSYLMGSHGNGKEDDLMTWVDQSVADIINIRQQLEAGQ